MEAALTFACSLSFLNAAITGMHGDAWMNGVIRKKQNKTGKLELEKN